MKKLIVLLVFATLTVAVSAQNLFRPVKAFPTKVENDHRVSLGEDAITHKWVWRFDATMIIAEVNHNKVTNLWSTTSLSAVGPGIGIKHYVPTSDIDPTPINNYGISLGLAIGKTIYDPQFAEAKLVLAADLWQFFKFGTTYTFNPPPDIAKFGLFFGGGITF